MLVAICDAEDCDKTCAEVNDILLSAHPSIDGDYVMLPGYDDGYGPTMSPCWAEHSVEQGVWNPLIGKTSIGLATPRVVVEYGHYDQGGIGATSAVAISTFDEFAAVFVDWLMNWDVLATLWGGDYQPFSPVLELFAAAATAPDHRSYCNSEDAEVENENQDETHCVSAYLTLHLPNGLIDQAQVRLSSFDRVPPRA